MPRPFWFFGKVLLANPSKNEVLGSLEGGGKEREWEEEEEEEERSSQMANFGRGGGGVPNSTKQTLLKSCG